MCEPDSSIRAPNIISSLTGRAEERLLLVGLPGVGYHLGIAEH
jgi:hypothetical protein